MPVHALVSLALRGVVQKRQLSTAFTSGSRITPDPDISLSPIGALAVFLISSAFIVILLCFRYTGWGVVGTLAFVETEQVNTEIDINGPPSYEHVTGEEADAPTAGLAERSIVVTSGVRRTLRHLRSIGGWRSLLRGFACFFCYHVLTGILASLISRVFYVFALGHLWVLAEVFGGLAASLLSVQMSTAWTHIVISEPSPKGWMRRLPPFRRTLTNLWLVTLVNQTCVYIAILVPFTMAGLSKLTDLDHNHMQARGLLIGKIIGVTTLSLALFLLLVLPSAMALSRAQASMLPEEDETIVAFDRSFDGKVEPAIVGGSGALGLVDAFKTISRESRIRVFKLGLKLAAVEVVLHVLFFIAMLIVFFTAAQVQQAH